MRIIICTETQYGDAEGIHLNDPDLWYFNDAVRNINETKLGTLYLHYPSQGARYLIPSDVLQECFNLTYNLENVQVRVIDPRGAK